MTIPTKMIKNRWRPEHTRNKIYITSLKKQTSRKPMVSGMFVYERVENHMTPSSRNFSCHFQAEARTSSIGVSAFQPSTLLALSTLPHTFSMSPSRRGANVQLSLTPVAFSKPCTTSKVLRPRPVPMLKISTGSVSCSSTRVMAAT